MDNQGITPEELNLLLSNSPIELSVKETADTDTGYLPRSRRYRKKRWWLDLFRA